MSARFQNPDACESSEHDEATFFETAFPQHDDAGDADGGGDGANTRKFFGDGADGVGGGDGGGADANVRGVVGAGAGHGGDADGGGDGVNARGTGAGDGVAGGDDGGGGVPIYIGRDGDGGDGGVMVRGARARSSLRVAKLRAFFAVPVPDALRAQLAGLIEELRAREHGAALRWVRAENLHITLRFLGNVPGSRSARARRRCGGCVARSRARRVHAHAADVFSIHARAEVGGGFV